MELIEEGRENWVLVELNADIESKTISRTSVRIKQNQDINDDGKKWQKPNVY
jgi:hypothetical protein